MLMAMMGTDQGRRGETESVNVFFGTDGATRAAVVAPLPPAHRHGAAMTGSSVCCQQIRWPSVVSTRRSVSVVAAHA